MKKVLAYLLSMVMVAALAISGTVAYLQHEDSDVNVMTLGNVKIEQHEYQRVENTDGSYKTIDVDGITSYELEEFEQAKPLYPFVGEVNAGYDSIPVRLGQLGHNSRGGMDVLPAKNVQDKFVVVENTGTSDAYVRTIVAFEAGSVVEEDWYKLISYSAHFTWKETQDWFVTEINGNNYYIVEFVYNGYQDIQHPNGVLKPGDYTYNSLAQVYMFDHATNEDVEALDGNDNGTFDILVLSQAVQTEGFADAATALDTAFGDTNPENVKIWFGDKNIPVVVYTVEEMREAMKKENKIIIGKDLVVNDDKGTGYAFYAKYDCEIDLNGNDLIVDLPGKDFYGLIYALKGAKVDISGDGNIVINNGIGPWIWCTGQNGDTEVNIYGGNWTNLSADFNNKDYSEGIYANRLGKINIYGGTFQWNDDFYKYTLNESREGIINIYGGTFINFDPRVSHDTDGSYVAEGYKVLEETKDNGDVWYTVVKQ